MNNINPGYCLAASIKPGNREHMLTAPAKLREVFRDPENAVKWLAIQIATCARKANVQAPSTEAVIETARILYQRFHWVQISHIALFFGYMQQGQRYDEWGTQQHYGSFDLNKIIDELTRAARKMGAEGSAIVQRKRWHAEKDALMKMEPFDLERAIREEPQKYGHIGAILASFGPCKVSVRNAKINA